MISFTILIVIVILWLADRAALRRRLDEIERSLLELRSLPRADPGEPVRPPVAPPPRPAAALPPAAPAPMPIDLPPAVEPSLAAPISGFKRAVRDLITGGNLIVRLGILILFFGVAFLLRYAAEHSHLTIEDRLIGVTCGAIALLVLGWRWRNSRRNYALALLGGGVGVLYLTVFAALRPYGLLSPGAAFALLAAIGVLSALLAIMLDSMAFAILATIGGFLAPVLAATAHGDEVTLFFYYALLDLVIVAIAWFRSWRPLNLLSFLFTYGIGTAWGVLRYRPDNYPTTEPFLILFFLLFVAVALLFAFSRASSRNYYVDGALVFGVPAATMSLQAAMLHGVPYALAYTSLGLSTFYLTLAWLLHRRQGDQMRLLTESFISLCVAFATLAIPLALEDRWTGAAWALEGAAVLWIGLRQNRRLAIIAGMLLQPAAAIAYFHDPAAIRIHQAGLILANTRLISEMMLCLGALVCAARLRHRTPEWLASWRPLIGGFMFFLGLAWWLHAGALEILWQVSESYWSRAWLVLAAVTAVWLSVLGGRLRWELPRFSALWLFPALVILALQASLPHPFASGGWWSWPLAFAAAYWTLYRDDSIILSGSRMPLHALGLWLVSFVAGFEAYWQTAHFVHGGTAWPDAAGALIPAIILLLSVRGSGSDRWPYETARAAYLDVAPCGLGIYLFAWGLLKDFTADGSALPLPYVPLINPLDLTQGIAIAATLYGVNAARANSTDTRRLLHLAAAFAAFAWLTAVLLRSLHHYENIPYTIDAMSSSTLAQTSLTIAWTLLALAAMVWANHVARRVAWITGAVLLAVVILKLFAVDLSRTGTVPRIVSFIGVGVLMLVIGFYSPLPPRENE